MKSLVLYGFGIGVIDVRSINKIKDKYEKIYVFVSKAPQGKAKEMLDEMDFVEIIETLNFYKEAKRKNKELTDSEIKDLGDFGDRAMMRDPC